MRTAFVIAVASMLAMLGSVLSTPVSARVGVLQAPGMDAVALAGSGVVVAPEQQVLELVAAGAAPRVLAQGPGLGGVAGDGEDVTMLQFAASGQALAYETASLGYYHGGELSFSGATGFGPLDGPYSPFPGAPGVASCTAEYPGGAFAPKGSPSGPFAIDGTRLASWPTCTSADAVLVRDLQAPGADLHVKLPDIGSPDETGGSPDEVGEIALSDEMLAVLVGTSDAAGLGPLAPEFLIVENIATGKGLYSSVNLDESGPIAVQSDGTAAIQLPDESRGRRLYATTYVISPANPTLQAISTDCVSTYGVKLVSGRVAQAVCGKGIVTTDLTGGDPETVLALGDIPATAFDYDEAGTAAVHPVCDGRDEVELASASADPTLAPPASCPASIAAPHPRVVHGAVRLSVNCAEGCAGSLELGHGRSHSSARFALVAPGGIVTVKLPRALREEVTSAHAGALLTWTLTVDRLTGGVTRTHGRMRIRLALSNRT